MMKKLIIPFVLLSGMFIQACTETHEPDPEEIGHNYYPLNVGDFRVYDVVQVQYRDNKVIDSAVFQFRELVDTVFVNQTGEETFKIIRSKRPDSSEVWTDDSVIVVNKSATDLRVTKINNRKVVKLIFPVKEGKSWNANAFNDLGEEIHYYRNVSKPYTLDGKDYPKTLTVVEAENVNNIEKDSREEVYAATIGLVSRKSEKLTYCNNPGVQKCEVNTGYIVEGTIRTETLNHSGR